MANTDNITLHDMMPTPAGNLIHIITKKSKGSQ